MIHIKNQDQIKSMQKGGKILSDVLWEVLSHVKEGVTEEELDLLAEKRIKEKGGEEGFKKVPGYRHTVCVATNDVVVHGIPTSYALQNGDVICIDCGVYLDGFHTDMAETVVVGGERYTPDGVKKFLATGKKALEEGIKEAKVGNRIGHISQKIQSIVEPAGYAIVHNLVGHGVGRDLHEEPEIPGFLKGSINKTPEIKEGMTLAIEVIYNMGSKDVTLDRDGWTIRTKDGSLSAVFERSIVVTKTGPELLTP
jgi:methionyl aminopeptidase